jgi:hypothetical protein
MVKNFILAGLAVVLFGQVALAGNDTKRGQAGATELLINPWARTTGMSGANSAWIRGVEALNVNPAGFAGIQNFEFAFANTQYLTGSGVSVNTAAFGQRVGDGVLGASVMSMNLGEFFETTYFLPDGTGNTFSPSYFNLAASYGRNFSDILNAGLTVRIVSQAVPNASATGACVDAGVQYFGGKRKQIKIGVALRNIGPKLNYSGDGLNRSATIDNNPSRNAGYLLSIQNIAHPFDLPALYNLGFAYEIDLMGDSAANGDHKLTPSYTFVSNSFTADQHLIGLEYNWRGIFAVRGGYALSQNVISGLTETDIHYGPSAGVSFDPPFDWLFGQNNQVESTDDITGGNSKNKKSIGIDYSYRASRTYGGTHSLGLVFKL